MTKFPAKYTQLPNFEHEYIEIIDHIYEGISKDEVENFIGSIKGSTIKAKYKHRTHLENLGLFFTADDSKVYMSKHTMDIKHRKITLQEGLLEIFLKNNELIDLFQVINDTGYFENKISKKELAEYLNKIIYYDTDSNTIYRYLREIINLFNIIGVKKIIKIFSGKNDRTFYDDVKYRFISQEIEKYYLKKYRYFGEPIAIEEIITELQKNNSNFNEENFLNWLFGEIENKYKFNFLKLPNWSTKSKSYKIDGELYTHLIIEY